MAVYAKELAKSRVAYEDHSLVATGTPVVSSYIRLLTKSVTVTKKHTTGTYALTIDWSMDGANSAFQTAPSMVDNTPQTLQALAPYARFTITATVSSFTVHQTTVMASNA